MFGISKDNNIKVPRLAKTKRKSRSTALAHDNNDRKH